MAEKRNVYRILKGKPGIKIPPGKTRCRSVDNIKMDLRGIGWGGMDWINVAHDGDKWSAPVKTVMNFRVT
jgi:hypothetical protein